MSETLSIRIVEHPDYLHVLHDGTINDMDAALKHFQTSLQYAQTANVPALLADLRGTRSAALTAIDRIIYFQRATELYHQWRRYTGREIRLAILQAAEALNSYTPGIEVATNSGLDCKAFNSESEALAWLRGKD